MSNQKANPKVEWGFYATVPRIVRTGPKYQDISHAAKWLYTCLKDLCGNHGSCFRALRTLSEETGISTGSLSTMIRELHDVGLIHAEKKSRGKGGKEVWHISVVDIWQANREYCSKIEQLSDGDVQILNNTLPVVQNLNDVVQKLNEPPPSCSENERSCSNFDDRGIDSEEQRYEARTGEEESALVAASSQSNGTHAFSDTILKELPDGDAVLLGWMADGKHNRIYRRSGKSLGALIPLGADVDAALQEFLTVESAAFDETDYRFYGTKK